MKKLTIRPVKERPEGVSEKDFKEAHRKGEIEVNAITAIEALKNGGGLYEIKPPAKQVVEVKGKEPEEMTKAELVAEMTAFGKPPRKMMSRDVAVQFVRDLRAKAEELIGDGDIEPEEEDN